MKTNYFYIYQKLPNFNDFRAETARNMYKGGQMKSEVEDSIITAIMYAKQQGTLKPIERYPIQINCVWGERTQRMDLDNRRASVKFILDAMQKANIIPNDNRRYICGLFDEFVVADKDYVKVEIIEPPLRIKTVLEGM
jgi:Holliday junction resolvase RusA-like endonuclease